MVESIDGINNSSAGESEMRVRLEHLYKIASDRQDVAPARNDTNTSPRGNGGSKRDSVSITREASVLAGSGLDKNQSVIHRDGDKLEFNLHFDTNKFSQMNTKGSFSPVSKEMSLFVSFNFQDMIKTDAGSESRHYNARIKLEARNVSPDTFSQLEVNGSKLEQNMDKMLQGMLERAYSKQYPPTSVVLNLSDIADLVSENGGVFQKVSRAMMLLNSTLARALEGGTSIQPGQALESALNSDGSIELKDFSFQLKEITPAIKPQSIGTGSGSSTPAVGSGESAPKPAPTPVKTGGGSVSGQ